MEKLREFRAVLTPQFSLYTEMPPAMQMYNIFRSRWVGAYLQSKGLKVIPTVYWGEPQSFWFSFEGIEPGSPVAVSTLGVRREKTLFLQGYEELLRRVHPSHILCYGEPFHEVLTIPYAQTNHLSAEKKAAPAPYYIKWITGHVIGTDAPLGGFLPTETEPREFPEKGMGRAGRAAAIGAAAAVGAAAIDAPKIKPNQMHHFATNKSQTYTKPIENIIQKYKLDLDEHWNKDLLPHSGRHPNAYHDYVLGQIKIYDSIARGNKEVFLQLFNELKQEIKANPDMLYRNYWLTK